ncbi:hypothetical protein C8A01DRAFT_40078 [Parachaetomium inaequale]|uniref:Uncharacterized protein n=1 Tax=Parachaetomium inaequale TaxID=2588326 RepID=A0AAN6P875_9PEZI|nr:hypothetical protein C8A01DRAFT_40078 [Parachaetomium inaequale]
MLYPNVTNEKDKPEQGMESFSYMNSTVGKEFPMYMPHNMMGRWPTDLHGYGSFTRQGRGRLSILCGPTSPPQPSSARAGSIPVHPIGSRVTYDMRYGVPAALVLLLWLGVIVVAAVGCTSCYRAGFATPRRRIGQLPVGRVFTTFLCP